MFKLKLLPLFLSLALMFTTALPVYAATNTVPEKTGANSVEYRGQENDVRSDKVEAQFLRIVLKLVQKGVEYYLKIDKKGKTIKHADFKVKTDHIFSDKHIKKGIMKLGKDKKAILKKFRDMIEDADKAGVLKNNVNNQIRTVINGYKVEVRAYIKDGELKGMDGFIVPEKDWPNTDFGNIVYLVNRYDD